jgi:type I restriction enzyme M protein
MRVARENAEDTKSGAGQYLPRALIKTMVACIQPKPLKYYGSCLRDWRIFWLPTLHCSQQQTGPRGKEFLKNKTFYGNEIVANTRRMCLMNMFLHNIGKSMETFIWC